MRSFLKYLLAAFTGTFIALFIIFLIASKMIGGAFDALAKGKDVTLKENSILNIDLPASLSDYSDVPPGFDPFNPKFEEELGLDSYIKAIRNASTDDNIKGIWLKVGFDAPPYAMLEELRDELISFRKSGKFILTYSDMLGQKSYYLASVSNKIYISPASIVEFRGMYAEWAFLKGLLEKLGIEIKVYKVGKYKSANELVENTEMSEANREQIREYVFSVYNHFLSNIGGERKMAPELLDSIANNLMVRNAYLAEEHGLVDDVIYIDEVIEKARNMVFENPGEDDKPNYITLPDYLTTFKTNYKDTDNKIAVIYAQGAIVDGNGKYDRIGSKTYSKLIRKLREDDEVKAIVLRINSPGGSALASELIWREAKLAAEEKTLVVSMSYLAASGGYYIACPADKIVAQPNSLLGSIGVWAAIPNMQKFYNEKLGITFDVVKTGPYSDITNVNRPITDEEGFFVQQEVDRLYVDFVGKVAKGRGMDYESAEALSQGRIWSGLQSVDNGLVDKIGGLDVAIAEAASDASLEDYRIVTYPKATNPFDKIRKMLNMQTLIQTYGAAIPGLNKYYQLIEYFNAESYYHMRMPYDLVTN